MNRRVLVLIVVLGYTAAFRLLVLNRPFEYDPEGSGCLNGVLARSYLRFGWSQTHGMPVLSLRPVPGIPVVFYPDHPPLVPLLIAPFYRIFGVGEWQTRLPISLLTLAAVYAIYLLVAHQASARAGLLAAALFAALPMTLYFGGFADVVGLPLIFFVLLATLAYMHFQRAPGRNTLIRLVAAFFLAGACDWPAFVIVPVFGSHFMATRPRPEWRWMLMFIAAACMLFVGLYAYITIATHSPWNWMTPLFVRRSGVAGGNEFTAGQWIAKAATFNRLYHTTALLIAAASWVIAYGFRRGQSRPGTTAVRLLLSWAALYIALGSKALYDHEWAWLPLSPAIAIAAALLIDRALTLHDDDRAMPIVVLVVTVFASSTAYLTFKRLYPHQPPQPYSPIELGQAIRAAAPRDDDVALLVDGEEAEAQLWFYGDRPLRTRIWSVDDFKHRIDDDRVDALYNFDDQPWKARATGLVFPRMFDRDFNALRRYLLQQHGRLVPLPQVLADKFEVFDLRGAQ